MSKYVKNKPLFGCGSIELNWRSYNSPSLRTDEDFVLVGVGEFPRVIGQTEGRILTIIDSVITNQNQLEAVKSLVKNSIREAYSDLWCAFLTEKQVKSIK